MIDLQKTFIILTSAITNTGGGPRYILAKKYFLEKHGWNVLVISKLNCGIILPGLEEYKQWTFPVLMWRPNYCFWFTRKKIYKLIGEQCKNSEKIVIESHQPILAEWGELIAKKLKAKHIIYLLDEIPPMQKKATLFMEFKHDRRELVGIIEQTIPILFKNIKEIEPEKKYVLAAGGTADNVVEDYEFPSFNSLPHADYNIGCIGRLEKPYIMSTCSETVAFAKKHPNEKINLILIGGSSYDDMAIKNIENEIAKSQNIHLLVSGSLSKIPKSFFDLTDVVIASSGSATAAYKAGALTISMDGNDHRPIGLLGYTTEETLFRKIPAEFSLSELLEKILVEKYNENLQFTEIPMLKESTEDMLRRHLDFIDNSSKEAVYFNSLIYSFSLGDIYRRILFALFGKNDGSFSKLYFALREVKRVLRKFKNGGLK